MGHMRGLQGTCDPRPDRSTDRVSDTGSGLPSLEFTNVLVDTADENPEDMIPAEGQSPAFQQGRIAGGWGRTRPAGHGRVQDLGPTPAPPARGEAVTARRGGQDQGKTSQ